ncbi:hypothetical protein P691DRAFT_678684 [Macrolepiota fuliginosa MF-IS2]|uniref:RING-14 protein n=1 Tax=Macrolepiota fuliginosa MF-IS2 TaxID=1400762 RepID=A0A9P5X3Q2_9AGAR|nr:hypothetical protein P691DRAFT_678684 [Macrolepiota fuliginosa MF-IS2]
MHFSKTYTQLLESLPQELQENSIQYHQLKEIINQVVKELSSLGLNPSLLHELLEAEGTHSFISSHISKGEGISILHPSVGHVHSDSDETHALTVGTGFPKIVYEFGEDLSRIEPHLRISLGSPGELGNPLQHVTEDNQGKANDVKGSKADDHDKGVCLYASLTLLLCPLINFVNRSQGPTDANIALDSSEIIVPLVSDGQFFELLCTTLGHMSIHMQSVQNDLLETVAVLSRTISRSARPASSCHSVLGGKFHPHSPLNEHPGDVRVQAGSLSKSDLYSWREIFQLYMEAEVFESVHEQYRGERSAEESERRLQLFTEQTTQRGLAAQGQFKLKESQSALETFLQLNVFILNIKFRLANAEATRKILKKHTKRTALPLPPDMTSSGTASQLVLLLQAHTFSLPHVLVQAIGETLLPIVPHLGNYSCLICTSIAFKPIRLNCGHLFCVRCLVKMQKQGKGSCLMCRAPSVLVANQTNVDWALMNFMQDWFPIEAKEKLKANEREATAESLRELGWDSTRMHGPCTIM